MTGASFWAQFELHQLRCFVAAAEELHFGRAAARMNMTQPPLSRQIQLLEHVLGVKLLDRTSRAVKLTPAGRVFLLEARRILRLTESAALATRRIAIGRGRHHRTWVSPPPAATASCRACCCNAPAMRPTSTSR